MRMTEMGFLLYVKEYLSFNAQYIIRNRYSGGQIIYSIYMCVIAYISGYSYNGVIYKYILLNISIVIHVIRIISVI